MEGDHLVVEVASHCFAIFWLVNLKSVDAELNPWPIQGMESRSDRPS